MYLSRNVHSVYDQYEIDGVFKILFYFFTLQTVTPKQQRVCVSVWICEYVDSGCSHHRTLLNLMSCECSFVFSSADVVILFHVELCIMLMCGWLWTSGSVWPEWLWCLCNQTSVEDTVVFSCFSANQKYNQYSCNKQRKTAGCIISLFTCHVLNMLICFINIWGFTGDDYLENLICSHQLKDHYVKTHFPPNLSLLSHI